MLSIRSRLCTFTFALMALPALAQDLAPAAAPSAAQPEASAGVQQSCFLLTELGKGEHRRRPAEACTLAVSPGATFYLPEAVAVLDSGLAANADDDISAQRGKHKDGDPPPMTLGKALREANQSAFQDLARRMGNKRQQAYLENFSYGNADIGSGIASFWLGGGSLLVSPEQQQAFLVQLWSRQLAVSGNAAAAVRGLLAQSGGSVTTALGQPHPFNGPWPAETGVDAIAASTTDATGAGVRWLIGHVRRGTREFVFVSCVTGAAALPDDAAILLAQTGLHEEGVLP